MLFFRLTLVCVKCYGITESDETYAINLQTTISLDSSVLRKELTVCEVSRISVLSPFSTRPSVIHQIIRNLFRFTIK